MWSLQANSNIVKLPAEDIRLLAPGLAVKIIVYTRNIVFIGINPGVLLWLSNRLLLISTHVFYLLIQSTMTVVAIYKAT